MRIVKLVAENVKRLHAVSITPEGSLVTVGGKNGAGKSSVLDSIAYAMGGERLVPSEPIRSGESEARIVVDLGDLVVTRRFKRDYLTETIDIGGNKEQQFLLACVCGNKDSVPEGQSLTPPCSAECGQRMAPIFGETTSTLTVTNKDGAKYPSPQAVLDKLLGKLTFDPLAFARAEAKEQDAILRRLVGLDVAPIEARRREAFDRRAMLKKTHQIKEAQLAALPAVKDAPAEEVSMEAIAAEMQKAEEYRKLAEEAEREVAKAQNAVVQLNARHALTERGIADLEMRLATEKRSLEEIIALERDASREQEAKVITAQAARAVVPDAEALRIKLKNTEVLNAGVRANKKRAEAQMELDAITLNLAAQHDLVVQAEQEKVDALANATFPVPGLGLSEDGITFNGHPFEQAGSAEQVRVSVAIGIALNPQLKVLLIRNGNLLDHASLAAVAAQAEGADMQVWMEYVTESSDGVAVMMVDGEVV